MVDTRTMSTSYESLDVPHTLTSKLQIDRNSIPRLVPSSTLGTNSARRHNCLWDPNTKHVVVSRDVTFHKSSFPMRWQPDSELNPNHCFPIDPTSFSPSPEPYFCTDSLTTTPSTSTANNPPPPSTLPANNPPPPTRPTRQSQSTTHYGNLQSYATAVSDSRDSDTPTYTPTRLNGSSWATIKSMVSTTSRRTRLLEPPTHCTPSLQWPLIRISRWNLLTSRRHS